MNKYLSVWFLLKNRTRSILYIINKTLIKMTKTKKKGAIELLVKQTRFSIYMYLEVYRELSLTQLSTYLNKSKSTILENIKVLKEIGFVEGPIPKIVKKKGDKNIVEHFYKLHPNYQEKLAILDYNFDYSNGLRREDALTLWETGLEIVKIQKSVCDIQRRFSEKLIENHKFKDSDENLNEEEKAKKKMKLEKDLKMAYEIINPCKDEDGKCIRNEKGNYIFDSEAFNSWDYFTRKQFRVFRERYFKMFEDLQEEFKDEEKYDPNEEKSLYFFSSAMPLKKMLDYLNEPKDEKTK